MDVLYPNNKKFLCFSRGLRRDRLLLFWCGRQRWEIRFWIWGLLGSIDGPHMHPGWFTSSPSTTCSIPSSPSSRSLSASPPIEIGLCPSSWCPFLAPLPLTASNATPPWAPLLYWDPWLASNRIVDPMTIYEDPLARPPNQTIRLYTWPRTSASSGHGVECYVRWLVRTVLPCLQLHNEMVFAWCKGSSVQWHLSCSLTFGSAKEPTVQ